MGYGAATGCFKTCEVACAGWRMIPTGKEPRRCIGLGGHLGPTITLSAGETMPAKKAKTKPKKKAAKKTVKKKAVKKPAKKSAKKMAKKKVVKKSQKKTAKKTAKKSPTKATKKAAKPKKAAKTKAVVKTATPKAPKGTPVTFVLDAPNGWDVALAGTFNKWEPRAMVKEPDGLWRITVHLAPGTYQYRFLVDTEWREDPINERRTVNEYGTHNSVIDVS